MLVLAAFFSKIIFKRYVLGSFWFGLLWGFFSFSFFLLFLYLTFAVQQWQEPAVTFLMLKLVFYYPHLWFASLPLKTSRKIW